MSRFIDLVDGFPAEYGAGADGGMRDVLRALLDDWQDVLVDLIAAEIPTTQALRAATHAALAYVADVLDVRLYELTDEAARLGAARRHTDRVSS